MASMLKLLALGENALGVLREWRDPTCLAAPPDSARPVPAWVPVRTPHSEGTSEGIPRYVHPAPVPAPLWGEMVKPLQRDVREDPVETRRKIIRPHWCALPPHWTIDGK